MKVTLENEKENVVKLDITVPAKEAADAYNQAVKRICASPLKVVNILLTGFVYARFILWSD